MRRKDFVLKKTLFATIELCRENHNIVCTNYLVKQVFLCLRTSIQKSTYGFVCFLMRISIFYVRNKVLILVKNASEVKLYEVISKYSWDYSIKMFHNFIDGM